MDNVDDAFLQHLFGMKLSYLGFYGTQITDGGLARLSRETDVESLDLFETPITDEGLKYVGAFSMLRELDLYDTQVTDAGLVHLAGNRELDVLSLSNTQITDAGLAQLEEHDKQPQRITHRSRKGYRCRIAAFGESNQTSGTRACGHSSHQRWCRITGKATSGLQHSRDFRRRR